MAAKRNTARQPDSGRAASPGPGSGKARLSAVAGKAPVSASLELDRLIHERIRLAIVSALAVNDVLTFNDLKQLLGATDGNLSVHARKLEDAGYVSCHKGFDGRMPRTEYRLSPDGRRALERYLEHMEGLIRGIRD
jgi:DNA-binding transcriptional ArsR family regulator